jgi:hypothetical protein
MSVLGRLALAALVIVSVSACRKAEARMPGPEPVPVLEVPSPPPRIVIPVAVQPPEPPAPPPPATDPDSSAGRGSRGAPPPVTRQPERTSPPAGQTETPPPVLQTTPNTEALVQITRDQIAVARANLAKVRRASLGDEAKDQYDVAQRFIQKAEEFLSVKNFTFARQLADNAAALSAMLVRGGAPAFPSAT